MQERSSTISVTLKLYASLGVHLPDHASRNEAIVPVPDGATIWELLDRYSVPRASCHLVLLNGIFQPAQARGSVRLADGDAVAVWPPVAGG